MHEKTSPYVGGNSFEKYKPENSFVEKLQHIIILFLEGSSFILHAFAYF